ncbi:PREDICTED: uncharacterized protein LOC105361399 [Ceratosolen solmsi marchali]|uniref:Uncharacterized protein LOC105361399 n=1 Tax=Ceratosolen solmsi marchali TaxID=326594 RepID=A0AAJ6YF15_9HYME|nr:PREDICTED: uncharacterized protein LOC105361399 [Ceratosolen solmsi marchali]
MDLEANLLLNYIPIISATVLTLVTWITVFYKLKNRWPVKVNCWFCNNNSRIERKSLDWWLCLFCNQHNGFSEDGDYNYEIPDQYKITNDSCNKNISYCERRDISINNNSLCKQCNRKEELKLLKLRELEDSIDVYNDKQIARFEASFEQKYPLCFKCQNIVTKVLYKQTLWLTQYKMLLFKQKPIRRVVENREKVEQILRILLSIIAIVTTYFAEVLYLPLCGIFFQLSACFVSPVNKKTSDILPLTGWACLIFVSAFSSSTILKMLKIYYDSTPVDDSTYQYFIITLGTAIALVNLKFKSYKTLSSEYLTFKKLESPNRNIFMHPSSLETAALLNEETSYKILSKKEPRKNSPVNLTDTLVTPSTIETPIPLKPTNLSHWLSGEKVSYAQNYTLSKASTFVPETEKSYINRTYSLNDSLSSLNSLSLGTQEKIPTLHYPRMFETRVYGTASPDLFNKQQRYCQKRSILAPARLRSVTQTSWVAGGYWQSGIDTPTLSRSSSQSSGFGSSGSNCGLSREPSVQEFDQYSVASEHCCFVRPENPLSTKNSNTVRRRGDNCSPRCSQMTEMICNTESLQHRLRNDNHCSRHTTVVTNPVWLPALLCGSLVFNMVVLCTILLR